MDSDGDEIYNSGFESDKHSGEGVEHDVNRFEIQTNSNLHVWQRIEIKEDEIAIEQGKN